MYKLVLLLSLLFFYFTPVQAQQLTGKDILEKIDQNMVAENRITVSQMTIRGQRSSRTMQSKSWTVGTDKSFTEYLAPAREKGTKMLKLKDELWIWSPDADRIIKIAGHMLRQSLMGSDVSYEDFMEDRKLTDIYKVEVAGEEEINKRLCYVLKLTATTEKVTYSSRKLWVDKERFLPLRSDMFAKSGKLLKTMQTTEMFQVENRWYPKKMNFKDALRTGAGTDFEIVSIEFNADIPDYIFSKASLKR